MLLFKDSVNTQISIRHYCHDMSSKLDHWEADLRASKELAIVRHEATLDETQTALPEGMFKAYKPEISAFMTQSETLDMSYESYKSLIARLEQSQAEMVVEILRKLMAGRGIATSTDEFINETMLRVVPADRVSAFVASSSDRRNERLQLLLESDKLIDWVNILRISDVSEGIFLEHCKREAEHAVGEMLSRRGKRDKGEAVTVEQFESLKSASTFDVADDLAYKLRETASDRLAHNNDYIDATRRIERVVNRTTRRVSRRLEAHIRDVLADNGLAVESR